MLKRDQPTRIGVVRYDGVGPIGLAGTLEAISMANRLLPGLPAVTIAERAGPVRCADGRFLPLPPALAGFAAQPRKGRGRASLATSLS
jgi:hypothetical protein